MIFKTIPVQSLVRYLTYKRHKSEKLHCCTLLASKWYISVHGVVPFRFCTTLFFWQCSYRPLCECAFTPQPFKCSNTGLFLAFYKNWGTGSPSKIVHIFWYFTSCIHNKDLLLHWHRKSRIHFQILYMQWILQLWLAEVLAVTWVLCLAKFATSVTSKTILSHLSVIYCKNNDKPF